MPDKKDEPLDPIIIGDNVNQLEELLKKLTFETQTGKLSLSEFALAGYTAMCLKSFEAIRTELGKPKENDKK